MRPLVQISQSIDLTLQYCAKNRLQKQEGEERSIAPNQPFFLMDRRTIKYLLFSFKHHHDIFTSSCSPVQITAAEATSWTELTLRLNNFLKLSPLFPPFCKGILFTYKQGTWSSTISPFTAKHLGGKHVCL